MLLYNLTVCFSALACYNTVFCQFNDIFTDSTLYEESRENRRSKFLGRKIEIHVLVRIVQPYINIQHMQRDIRLI